ncbi:MAG: VOC family protein [Tateyamaria sp.]|uniref:VOC family protein n=1 Tax=Tateyamaria sp. TaxID=1929288 RepID=UPI0032693286
MILDHLVVGATTLAEAQAYIEDRLGVAMQPGGQHAIFHTHNTLLGLDDGLYLEAIAPDPDAPVPVRPRWYDLDRFSGPARLSNWAASVQDMESKLAQMPQGCGAAVDVARGDLRWRMAVSPDGTTPFDNLWPALISWPKGMHPAARLTPTGLRLTRFTLIHPDAALAATLAEHIVDPRISVEVGPVAMQAEFDTPHGPRVL